MFSNDSFGRKRFLNITRKISSHEQQVKNQDATIDYTIDSFNDYARRITLTSIESLLGFRQIKQKTKKKTVNFDLDGNFVCTSCNVLFFIRIESVTNAFIQNTQSPRNSSVQCSHIYCFHTRPVLSTQQ